MLYVNNKAFSVGNDSFSISSTDIMTSRTLVDTYLAALKTNLTLQKVADQSGLNYSVEELRGMISASSVNNTEILSISVTSINPHDAEKIANTIAEVLPEQISSFLEGSSVRVVDYATLPGEVSSPNVAKNTMMGAIIGAVIACAVIIIRVLMDTQIHDEDYLIQTYRLPILSTVPDLSGKGAKSGYYTAYEYSDKGRRAK